MWLYNSESLVPTINLITNLESVLQNYLIEQRFIQVQKNKV